MTNQAKHTPIPWRVNKNNPDAIISENGSVIAGLQHIKQANAEFIVRACNSHEEILAILKQFQHCANNYIELSEDFYKRLDKAIAKAAGRLWAEAGINQGVIMRFMGHVDPKITAQYIHTSATKLKDVQKDVYKNNKVLSKNIV